MRFPSIEQVAITLFNSTPDAPEFPDRSVKITVAADRRFVYAARLEKLAHRTADDMELLPNGEAVVGFTMPHNEADALANKLQGQKLNWWKDFDLGADEDHDEDEEGFGGMIDVRLQVQDDGDWTVHTGDSSYDQDHRGFWGHGSLSWDDNMRVCRELAYDMIEQARDHYAQTK